MLWPSLSFSFLAPHPPVRPPCLPTSPVLLSAFLVSRLPSPPLLPRPAAAPPPFACAPGCALAACAAAFPPACWKLLKHCAGAGAGCCPGPRVALLTCAPLCSHVGARLRWRRRPPSPACAFFSVLAGGCCQSWALRSAINDGAPVGTRPSPPCLPCPPAMACLCSWGGIPGARRSPCRLLRPIGQPVLLRRLPPNRSVHRLLPFISAW